MNAILTSAVWILLLLKNIASEDSFCGNKCYGQGVITSRSCHCDMACSVYNDCCADSKYFEKNKIANKTRSFICKRKALVVNSCAKEWNGPDFIVNSCKVTSNYEVDPVGNSPVTSEATGVTYNNYYCAICNGDAENLIMWNIKVSCPLLNPNLPVDKDEALKFIFYNHPRNEWGYVQRDEANKKISFHECAVTSEIAQPHESKIRGCGTEQVSECSSTWKKDTIRDMCGGYTDPVYSNGTKYKNFYCAVCNRLDHSNLSCGEAIGPRHNGHSDTEDKNKMSFSLLLDINFSESNSVGKRLALLNCKKGEIFDPFARRCRNIVCGIPGYSLQDGMCVADIEPLL